MHWEGRVKSLFIEPKKLVGSFLLCNVYVPGSVTVPFVNCLYCCGSV